MDDSESWSIAPLGEPHGELRPADLQGALAGISESELSKLRDFALRCVEYMQNTVKRRGTNGEWTFARGLEGALANHALRCVDRNSDLNGDGTRRLQREIRWAVYTYGVQLLAYETPLYDGDLGIGSPPLELPALSDDQFVALVLRIAAFSIEPRLRVPVCLSWLGYTGSEIDEILQIDEVVESLLFESERKAAVAQLVSQGHHAVGVELALRRIQGRPVTGDAVRVMAERFEAALEVSRRGTTVQRSIRATTREAVNHFLDWFRSRRRAANR